MKKIGLVLVATMLSSVSFAQTQATTETLETPKNPEKATTELTTQNQIEKTENLEKYKRVVVDESMANREGKKYTVNATLLGMSFGSPETAIEAGIHTKPDTVISLAFHDLKGITLSDQDSKDEYVFDGDGRGKAITLSLKKFTSNSFYIKPALYHRTQTTIKSGIKAYNSSTDSWVVESRNTADYTDVGLSFAIGNQWQWENFTLGCNWVGISKSLTTLDKNGYLPQSDLDSASALNFYMGATF